MDAYSGVAFPRKVKECHQEPVRPDAKPFFQEVLLTCVTRSYSVISRKLQKQDPINPDEVAPTEGLGSCSSTAGAPDDYNDAENDEENDDDDASDNDDDSDFRISPSRTIPHAQTAIPYELSMDWLYGDHTISDFISSGDITPSFGPVNAFGDNTCDSDVNPITSALFHDPATCVAYSDETALADTGNTAFLSSIPDSFVMDYDTNILNSPAPEPSLALAIDTQFSSGENCVTNTRPLANGNLRSREPENTEEYGPIQSNTEENAPIQSNTEEYAPIQSSSMSSEHGKVQFTLTMSQPSVETLQSLMRIAVESQAKFRVEKD